MLGDMTEGRKEFTSAAITETIEAATVEDNTYVPLWSPVKKGMFVDKGVKKDVKVIKKGELTPRFGTLTAEGQVHLDSGEQLKKGDKVLYFYDNVTIPQNDLPTYGARMTGIALEAHARRIAVYYSQMAAFQAKQEMGINLGDILATQACAELSYEIDTEVVDLLVNNAEEAKEPLVFNKTVPAGVSKAEHYEGFAEVLEQASQVIYDRTKKHAANYMICASNVKPILSLMRGWKPAAAGKINGPYFAGTINGIKVFISPAIEAGKFVLGFNGDDMVTSAAVYAPYMAIVPTALLQFADGGNSQGFSTLYDLKLLNKALLVPGHVVAEDQVIKTQAIA